MTHSIKNAITNKLEKWVSYLAFSQIKRKVAKIFFIGVGACR
jgi:hypothetical protein